MLSAQPTLLRVPSTSPEHQAVVAGLREQVPNPILAHYLRLVEQGRKGVAPVRHGVCTACHMRVPASMTGSLMKQDDLTLCENCGCYLFLPAEEMQAMLPKKPVAAAVGRKTRRTSEAAAV
ncbi:hypothetical protein DB347_01765 [Opitutaceae bacterium EW11]|nr:hypothetical protein DB347_01765 [Opitutaceae bacterium EW11]